ncbi:hypothetical protein NA57DRAFT_75621 [Rhizodiscina lignyota]|uniref:BZIP domain-containing protein n=1 Tax=Rhizodiscina lignyota TaxID=1504668 RepID=A0A9P4M7L5_9PEZI|nr:hypothetical protein NA57DRAFT_75621 [Rhizodiscina lignyota]
MSELTDYAWPSDRHIFRADDNAWITSNAAEMETLIELNPMLVEHMPLFDEASYPSAQRRSIDFSRETTRVVPPKTARHNEARQQTSSVFKVDADKSRYGPSEATTGNVEHEMARLRRRASDPRPPSRNEGTGSISSMNSGTGSRNPHGSIRRNKMGRPSRRSATDANEEGSKNIDHERSLQRNRQAAERCRMRKKIAETELQEEVHGMESNNAHLKDQAAMLNDEVLNLKAECLQHVNCECDGIRHYLTESIDPGRRGQAVQ